MLFFFVGGEDEAEHVGHVVDEAVGGQHDGFLEKFHVHVFLYFTGAFSTKITFGGNVEGDVVAVIGVGLNLKRFSVFLLAPNTP